MLINYVLRIREDEVSLPNPYAYNNPNFYLDSCKYMECIRQANHNFENDFARVINLIVSLGGVIDFKKDSLEEDWKIFINEINIKIPESAFNIIQNHPSVVYIKKI